MSSSGLKVTLKRLLVFLVSVKLLAKVLSFIQSWEGYLRNVFDVVTTFLLTTKQHNIRVEKKDYFLLPQDRYCQNNTFLFDVFYGQSVDKLIQIIKKNRKSDPLIRIYIYVNIYVIYFYLYFIHLNTFNIRHFYLKVLLLTFSH